MTETPEGTQHVAKAPARRRGRGEGGVRKRGDGRWEGSIDLGSTGSGRKRKLVYAKTKQELTLKMRQAQRALDDGVPLGDGRLTVRAFLDAWVTTILPGTVGPATLDNYRRISRLHLLPALGRIALAKLQPSDVERLLSEKKAAGYSANTIRLIRSTLRRALGHAERRGLVVRNAAGLVDGPRIPKTTRRAMTLEEIHRFLDAAEPDRLAGLWALLAETGLRIGEALALTWDGIDFEAATLTVTQTFARDGGRLVLSAPKTASGRRSMGLSPGLLEALKSHRTRQRRERLAAGPSWGECGLVFVTERGTHLDPSNVRHRYDAVLAAAGLGHWTMHELRHTAASLMLSKGVPLHVVSERLGHAGIAITKDVYGHLVADDDRRATEAMSRALYGR